jgi:hypothetical protein
MEELEMRRMLILSTVLGMTLVGCVGSDGSSLSSEEQIGTIVAQTQMAQTAVAQTVEAALAPVEVEDTPILPGPGDVAPPELLAAETATAEGIQVMSSTRVLFEPGGTRAAFEGTLGAWQADEYVVAAMAGQILQVTLSPPGGAVYLKIYEQDGKDMMQRLFQRTSFWIPLPETQDYIIKVISETPAQAYSVNISVPAMVEFASGETSKSIDGHVSESNTVDYMIYAEAGQTLHVTVTTPSVQVALSVLGMQDGQPYLRYIAEETNWTFTLPMRQYYKISVVTIGPATDFTLVVEVTG